MSGFISHDGFHVCRKNRATKVVCIPAPAALAAGRTTGEVVPSDLWAWRKYGQKPIKGSPYPRYVTYLSYDLLRVGLYYALHVAPMNFVTCNLSFLGTCRSFYRNIHVNQILSPRRHVLLGFMSIKFCSAFIITTCIILLKLSLISLINQDERSRDMYSSFKNPMLFYLVSCESLLAVDKRDSRT
jgi:hypothetical protein